MQGRTRASAPITTRLRGFTGTYRRSLRGTRPGIEGCAEATAVSPIIACVQLWRRRVDIAALRMRLWPCRVRRSQPVMVLARPNQRLDVPVWWTSIAAAVRCRGQHWWKISCAASPGCR